MYDDLRKLVLTLAGMNDLQLLEAKSKIHSMPDSSGRKLILYNIDLFLGKSPERRAHLAAAAIVTINRLEREEKASSSKRFTGSAQSSSPPRSYRSTPSTRFTGSAQSSTSPSTSSRSFSTKPGSQPPIYRIAAVAFWIGIASVVYVMASALFNG